MKNLLLILALFVGNFFAEEVGLSCEMTQQKSSITERKFGIHQPISQSKRKLSCNSISQCNKTTFFIVDRLREEVDVEVSPGNWEKTPFFEINNNYTWVSGKNAFGEDLAEKDVLYPQLFDKTHIYLLNRESLNLLSSLGHVTLIKSKTNYIRNEIETSFQCKVSTEKAKTYKNRSKEKLKEKQKRNKI
tara:strand:+ start:51 stop:617 length:567 start_codon:yes stop_codon:yes gene_type:complete